MSDNKNSLFNPRNPIFLNFAKWLVILSSTIFIFIGIIGLTSDTPEMGLAIILGSIFNYFTGMVIVNMLYNIRDIKEQTKETNVLLKKQIEYMQKNEIN